MPSMKRVGVQIGRTAGRSTPPTAELLGRSAVWQKLPVDLHPQQNCCVAEPPGNLPLPAELLCGRTASRSTLPWQNCWQIYPPVAELLCGRTASRSTPPWQNCWQIYPPSGRTAVWLSCWQIFPPKQQNCCVAELLADLPPMAELLYGWMAGRFSPKWQNCCVADLLCGSTNNRSNPPWPNCW